MNPLICFFENENYIFSESYQRFSCPLDQSVTDFLNSFQIKYFDKLKIVQVNFEHENTFLFSNQTELYPAAKATVFVLESYNICKMNELSDLFSNPPSFKTQFNLLTSQNEFIEKVLFIKKEISKGRIYQTNLTSPLKATTEKPAIELFFSYEKKYNGSYKAYLPLTSCDVLCYSPELFLKKSADTLLSRPIKGSTGSDKDFTENLIKNKKEDAELSMIVDLLRNDLNSLSEVHRAEVNTHRAKIELNYIQHTYSEISVKNHDSLPFILQKLMPGGSISGCPKKESLLVIRETEIYKRQVYTGSIGWWQKNDFCLNLAIRTFIKSDNALFYHAGCGVVYDSNPENEWQEYLLKTGSLDVTI